MLGDGRIVYCRIVYYGEQVYIVEGHSNWRPDISIAIAVSAEDAEAKRKALCTSP